MQVKSIKINTIKIHLVIIQELLTFHFEGNEAHTLLLYRFICKTEEILP